MRPLAAINSHSDDQVATDDLGKLRRRSFYLRHGGRRRQRNAVALIACALMAFPTESGNGTNDEKLDDKTCGAG